MCVAVLTRTAKVKLVEACVSKPALSPPAITTTVGCAAPTRLTDLPAMSASHFDKATENLVRWAARDEWLQWQLDLYTAHVAPVADILGVSDDEFEELIGDAAGMLRVSSSWRISSPPASVRTARKTSSTTI